jgi:PhnB protein
MSDESEIREILTGSAKALRAKDVEQLFAHRATGYFSFDLDPPLMHKTDAARAKAATKAWFATWNGPIGWEHHDVVVHASGDVAFATSLSHITGLKTGGEHISLWVRSTDGFRKQNGAWKFVHSHDSVPFYMDGSYKAAIDLKP